MTAVGKPRRPRRPSAGPGTPPAGGDHAALRTWLRLLACSSLVEREVRRRLRDGFDITLPRFDVLAQLDLASREQASGLTMSELSRRLMVTNGNLTALVEALVGERLVTRLASPTDRRTQIVRLTPSGKRALDAMTPAHEGSIAELFGGLSAAECAQLHQLLGRLRGSIRDSLSEGPA